MAQHSAALTRAPAQHLLFNRVGLHLEMRNAHTDPAALLRLTNNVRQMYMDYELAKRLLRTADTQESPPAAAPLRRSRRSK